MDDAALADLFAAFGPVKARRMFGGAGIYAEGVMFALDADDTLYLKADAALAAELLASGSAPFSYETSRGRRTIGSFWRVPDAALDQPDDLAALARRALAVALAAAEEKAGAKASKAARKPALPAASARRQRAVKGRMAR